MPSSFPGESFTEVRLVFTFIYDLKISTSFWFLFSLKSLLVNREEFCNFFSGGFEWMEISASKPKWNEIY